MKKADFNKLKTGYRVSVTGTQDGRKFTNETGTVVGATTGDVRLVRFDGWNAGHSGAADDGNTSHWFLENHNARRLTITVLASPATAPVIPEARKAKKRPHGAQEYKGNGKHSWEVVTEQTVRLRVPGGWLYGRRVGSSVLAHRVFVPVPQAVGYSV